MNNLALITKVALANGRKHSFNECQRTLEIMTNIVLTSRDMSVGELRQEIERRKSDLRRIGVDLVPCELEDLLRCLAREGVIELQLSKQETRT